MFSASPRCGPRVLYKCAMYSLGWSVLISTLHKFDPAEFLDTPFLKGVGEMRVSVLRVVTARRAPALARWISSANKTGGIHHDHRFMMDEG